MSDRPITGEGCKHPIVQNAPDNFPFGYCGPKIGKQKCLHCGMERIQVWGEWREPVRDIKITDITEGKNEASDG